MDYRYKLDPGSAKFACPGCGQRRFVRYVDTATGEYMPERYGRCDREINCGYHSYPYSEGLTRAGRYRKVTRSVPKPEPAKPLYPVPVEVLRDTLRDYHENQFVQNLLHNVPYPIGKVDMERVISQYYVGTMDRGDGRRNGTMRGYATTFPFIDRNNVVRAIQAKQFDNGNYTSWTGFVHSIIESKCVRQGQSIPEWVTRYKGNISKIPCLFVEHLLDRYPSNPVALVEAPKTAIIGTLYFGFPEKPSNMLWLATGSLGYLTYDRCRELAGRNVFLFPDLSRRGEAFLKWSERVDEFRKKMPGTRFTVSTLLESNATEIERLGGCDLADYLIRLDWRGFRNQRDMAVKEKWEDRESDII